MGADDLVLAKEASFGRPHAGVNVILAVFEIGSNTPASAQGFPFMQLSVVLSIPQT